MKILTSIYSLQSKEGMHLYYSAKERFDRFLNDRENFILQTAKILKERIKDYDNVIIPESSNNFIESVIKNTGKPYIIIKKNNLDYIISNISTLGLQKKEAESHLQRMSLMGETFKINSLKSNQRRKYLSLLFNKTIVLGNNNIIIDDSCFSGTTINAIKEATGCKTALCIFSK